MLLISFTAFLISTLVAGAVVRWGHGHARLYGADMPQRFHAGHVPRLGGLALLAGVVWQLPVLWELALVVAIGGAYWIFFRIPPAQD